MSVMRQSGGRYRRDAKSGVRTRTLVYNITTEVELDTFVVPTADNPLGLPEKEREAIELPDLGDFQLTISLEGVPDGGSGSGAALGESWEIRFASEQKPIEAFNRWEAFAKKYAAKYDPRDPDKFVGFAKKIKLGGELVKNPAYGVDSYLSPKAILICTFTERQLDTSIWKNLGKIDTPRTPGRFRMPRLEGGRNWLKHSAIPIERGNVVEHRLEWWLSDEGGWLYDIYAPRG